MSLLIDRPVELQDSRIDRQSAKATRFSCTVLWMNVRNPPETLTGAALRAARGKVSSLKKTSAFVRRMESFVVHKSKFET